ncbi:hypothetical protein BDW22DRAFT_1357838 [Trametopsis cervina]|nr:hypothetical protein BDW22DRAFT_1357838 [Trametopsis cervina]
MMLYSCSLTTDNVRRPRSATLMVPVMQVHIANLPPPFAPTHIVSDSRYAIQGLIVHLPRWKDQGWIGIADAELV